MGQRDGKDKADERSIAWVVCLIKDAVNIGKYLWVGSASIIPFSIFRANIDEEFSA